MNALGIRVSSQEVFYAIVTGTTEQPSLITKAKLVAPNAYTFPESLAWYRERIGDLLTAHTIAACGIKTAEPISRSMGAAQRQGAVKRTNIEGVVMEVSASKRLKVMDGNFSAIGSRLDADKPKKYLTQSNFRDIPEWERMNTNYKEAILAGSAALGEI